MELLVLKHVDDRSPWNWNVSMLSGIFPVAVHLGQSQGRKVVKLSNFVLCVTDLASGENERTGA